jgi:hypothetical protein
MTVFRTFLVAICFKVILAASVAADPFHLFITVYGLPDEPLRARIHYLLEGRTEPSQSDFVTMSEDERDNLRQFYVRMPALEFPGGGDEGVVWGTITRADGTVALRVPVTHFTEATIAANDRRHLFLKLRARPAGWEAFRESYPIYLPDRGLFTDENVAFLLEVFRTLVDEEFVGDEQWQRIYEKFLTNIGYFAEGNSEKFGRILTFLEARYRGDLVRAERQLHFVRFYARFLSEILKQDIGGRPAPHGGNLESYTMLNLRTVVENDPEVVLPVVLDTVASMYRSGNWRSCIEIAEGTLAALAGRQSYWSGASLDGDRVPVAKVLLKRTVDCLQLHYTLTSDEPGRSSGDLAGGSAFSVASPEIDRTLLTHFMSVYEELERMGQFPARDSGGAFRQVYEYYTRLLQLL